MRCRPTGTLIQDIAFREQLQKALSEPVAVSTTPKPKEPIEIETDDEESDSTNGPVAAQHDTGKHG